MLKGPIAHLVQHRLGHMVIKDLGWSISVAVFGANVRTDHNQDAGTVRVAEIARLGLVLGHRQRGR